MRLRVQIDGAVRHLDVGSTYPGGGEATKGLAVRQLKSYVSWVQTVEKRKFFGSSTCLNPRYKTSKVFVFEIMIVERNQSNHGGIL